MRVPVGCESLDRGFVPGRRSGPWTKSARTPQWASSRLHGLSRLILLLIAALLGARPLFSDSVASKNRQGNRLFEQQKYQDAEKAYLDAQLDAPGRPELLYNHGNSLIKQKKYDQAAQSLRQAVSKGDRGLQANSWYNLGNALFEAGKYQEAARGYIEALRINPSDRDAKNNLELAWKRLQESRQKPSGGNGKEDDKKNQESQEDQQQDSNQSKDGEKQQQSSEGRQDPRQTKQQPSQAERKEASISKEQAMQILDAMKNQELAEQRKLLERQGKRTKTGKDW